MDGEPIAKRLRSDHSPTTSASTNPAVINPFASLPDEVILEIFRLTDLGLTLAERLAPFAGGSVG